MQRVSRATAVAVQPAAPTPGTPGFFTGGNPGGGIAATVPGFEWFNNVQEELVALVLRSGLALDGADQAQLRKSLDRLFGGGLSSVSATGALTADQAGLVLASAAGGAVTLTLPAANAANGRPVQYRIVRTDSAANALTVQRAGADTIEGATSLTVPVGGRLTLMSDGVSAWRVVAEAATGRSYAANGWQRLPGGLIIQWGTASATTGALSGGIAEGSASITFPVTFPTACVSVVATPNDVSGASLQEIVWAGSITTSGCGLQLSCRQATTPMTASWLAVGY